MCFTPQKLSETISYLTNKYFIKLTYKRNNRLWPPKPVLWVNYLKKENFFQRIMRPSAYIAYFKTGII